MLSLIQSDSRLSALCRGTETPICVGKEKGLLGVYNGRLKWRFNIPGALSDLRQGSNWSGCASCEFDRGTALASQEWGGGACARLPRGRWCDFDTAQDTSKDNPRVPSLIWKAIHMGTKAARCPLLRLSVPESGRPSTEAGISQVALTRTSLMARVIQGCRVAWVLTSRERWSLLCVPRTGNQKWCFSTERGFRQSHSSFP